MGKSWKMAALAMVGVYLFFALIHLFMQRPLWNDEACVLRSISFFSTKELFTEQLRMYQVFPRVYLWCIQQVSSFFLYSVLSLRAIPFMAMVAAFFIWLSLAGRELRKGRLFFLFVLSWSSSAFLVYYAAELKQYSFDVLAAAIFLLYLRHQQELFRNMSRLKYGIVLCSLPFLCFFSYPAFLFLVFPLWNVIRDIRERPQQWPVLAWYVLTCVAVVSCSYWFDMRLRGTVVVIGYADYFISVRSVGEFLKTFGEGLNSLVGRWFAEEPRWVRFLSRFFMVFAMAQMFLGWRRAWKEEGRRFGSIATVAMFVFFELCVLGLFKFYPFIVPRTVLFFCPVLIVLMLKAFDGIEAMKPRIGLIMQAIYGIFLLVMLTGVGQALWRGYLSVDLTPYLLRF